jgi:hypothetical protein
MTSFPTPFIRNAVEAGIKAVENRTGSDSHSISRLVSSLGKNGLQDKTKYGATIYSKGSGGAGFMFLCDPYLIDVVLPGPRYTFYLDNYWRGNPEFKSPSGIRFDEPLVMTFMVPLHGLDTPLSGSGDNLLSFINAYQKSYFSSPWRTQDMTQNQNPYFKAYDVKNELEIHILSYGKQQPTPINKYIYNRCYLEKILPFQFSATESGFQTMTLSFVVSSSSSLG